MKMNLSTIFATIFLLIYFIIFFTHPAYAIAPISNGDFESSSIAPWEGYSGAQGSVSNTSHGGTQSVKVDNDSTSSYGIQQTVTGIEVGKTYNMSAFIKVTDGNLAKALLRIAWYSSTDGSGSQKSTKDSSQITTTTDWEQLTLEVAAPAGVASAKIRLVIASKVNQTTAFAYFDDVEFVEVTATPTPSPTSAPTATPIKTPTPTKTSTQTPTPTQTVTKTSSPIPTKTSKAQALTSEASVLAENITTEPTASLSPTETPSPTPQTLTAGFFQQNLSIIFIIAGGICLLAAGILFYRWHKQEMFDETENSNN